MKKIILLILTVVASPLFASNTFNCKVANVQSTMSLPDFVIVTMECSDTTNPITSGTNGCTAANISDNSFLFDTSTNHGKLNLSVILTAYAAGKRIYASTYATCPSGGSVPLLYGVKTFND